MKILAFSDLHRNVEAARKIVEASAGADVLVGAGDFATRGQGASDTIEILRTVGIPTILVSGNHDNLQELQDLCSDWPDGHVLCGHGVMFGGVSFHGLGGEIPRRDDSTWNEAMSEQEASLLLAGCADHAVLVTHTPPYGCADLQADRTHEGSKAILAAIEEKQPVLNLCGHIHFSWGASGRIGKTFVHNLGPVTNWFEI